MRIQSKIILAVVALTAIAVSVIAFYASSIGRNALRDKTFDQLTAVRSSKARLVEELFLAIEHETVVFSEDPTIVDALVGFGEAYPRLEPVEIEDRDLLGLYEIELEPIRAKGGDPVPEHFMPRDAEARVLQAIYLRDNPFPKGQRQDLVTPDPTDTDPTLLSAAAAYSERHAEFHPFLTEIQQQFGFYDVFLIGPDGRLLYSVFKEIDYAADLASGPLATSGLAEAWRMAMRQPDRGRAQFTDFRRYRPSGDAAASFAAAPVFDGNRLVGVFAVQKSADRFNEVLTGGGNWADEGLGATGEVFVVGSDYLFRSDARGFVEDPEAFLAEIQANGERSEVIDGIRADGTTALNLGDRTEFVQAALDGKSGTATGVDYRGHEVLVSYAPLDVEGLHFAILAEIDDAEAFAPIRDLNRKVAVMALGILLLSVIAALLLGYLISRPLARLRQAIHALREGRTDAEVPTEGGGEVAAIGRAYCSLRDSLVEQKAELEETRKRRESMLRTLMPATFANKLEQDAGPAVDELPRVCVLHAGIHGLDEALQRLAGDEAAGALGDLLEAFDSAARGQGAETLRVAGSGYIAVSGLGDNTLDLSRRMILLAREMRQSCLQFNRRLSVNLTLSIGIHVGPAVATLTGKRRILFDLYGEAPGTARALSYGCPPGAVSISDAVRKTLDGQAALEPLHIDGMDEAYLLLDLDAASLSAGDSAAGMPALAGVGIEDVGPSGEDA